MNEDDWLITLVGILSIIMVCVVIWAVIRLVLHFT